MYKSSRLPEPTLRPLWMRGIPSGEIAKRCNVNPQLVSTMAKKYGLPPRDKYGMILDELPPRSFRSSYVEPYKERTPEPIKYRRRQCTFFPGIWTARLDNELFSLANDLASGYAAITTFCSRHPKITLDAAQGRFHKIAAAN